MEPGFLVAWWNSYPLGSLKKQVQGQSRSQAVSEAGSVSILSISWNPHQHMDSQPDTHRGPQLQPSSFPSCSETSSSLAPSISGESRSDRLNALSVFETPHSWSPCLSKRPGSPKSFPTRQQIDTRALEKGKFFKYMLAQY